MVNLKGSIYKEIVREIIRWNKILFSVDYPAIGWWVAIRIVLAIHKSTINTNRLKNNIATIRKDLLFVFLLTNNAISKAKKAGKTINKVLSRCVNSILKYDEPSDKTKPDQIWLYQYGQTAAVTNVPNTIRRIINKFWRFMVLL